MSIKDAWMNVHYTLINDDNAYNGYY